MGALIAPGLEHRPPKDVFAIALTSACFGIDLNAVQRAPSEREQGADLGGEVGDQGRQLRVGELGAGKPALDQPMSLLIRPRRSVEQLDDFVASRLVHC